MHPWELERYTADEVFCRAQGMIWRERKRDLSLVDSTRNIMATIMNFAGRSLKKGVMKRPQDIIRLPHEVVRKGKDFDIKKLWNKELAKKEKHEHSSGNH